VETRSNAVNGEPLVKFTNEEWQVIQENVTMRSRVTGRTVSASEYLWELAKQDTVYLNNRVTNEAVMVPEMAEKECCKLCGGPCDRIPEMALGPAAHNICQNCFITGKAQIIYEYKFDLAAEE